MGPAKKSLKIRQNLLFFLFLPIFHWKILNLICSQPKKCYWKKSRVPLKILNEKKAENQKGVWLVQKIEFLKKPQNLNIQDKSFPNSSSDASDTIFFLVKNFNFLSKKKEKIEIVFINIFNHNQHQTSRF